MPLKKILLRPGINQENTRYLNENGWWVGDKVRFRHGSPEVIGGWVRYTNRPVQGICRSLYPWVDLRGYRFTGVGTHSHFFIELGTLLYDVTPFQSTVALTDPFSTTLGSTTIEVTDVAHGTKTGSRVVFFGASPVAGLDLNAEFVVTVTSDDTYTIESPLPADSTTTGGGSVTASYVLLNGYIEDSPITGWGAGEWGGGAWGIGEPNGARMRSWSQSAFGEDLVFAPFNGALYTWTPAPPDSLTTRAVRVDSLPGASDVPERVNLVTVSDIFRFVIAFGATDYGSSDLDPMLIRWADQESLINWTPQITNQAGSLRLSRGAEILAQVQLRQEIVVFTDTAVYSLQYQGPPSVWGAQLVGSDVSIASPNAVGIADSVALWMGREKFYMYNGQVQTLKCEVLRYVFDDLNEAQMRQVFAAPVAKFNEMWWFYPSKNSFAPDRYVIYNYLENVWSVGTLTRYAWVDSGLFGFPLAAGDDRLVAHETGVDDVYADEPQPLNAYIESTEFDIDDGDRATFVRRVVPDITFRDSTATAPSATLTLYPLSSSGSGLGTSVGGVNNRDIVRSASGVVEEFTEQLNIRVRGRQLILRVESNQLGTTWRVGAMRLDIRQDGGRG